jgi:lysophospholipase L1-like esterase
MRTAHATPRLRSLVDELAPDVVLVALGANLRGADSGAVRRQVEKLAAVVADVEAVTGRRMPWIWIGPPNTRKTAEAPETDAAFYEALRAAVADQGAAFIDSRPLTPRYSGPDGLHFGSEQGTAIATLWAAAVFQQVRDLAVGA